MNATKFLLTCPACSTNNRITMGAKSRCGKCKREFTPVDLTKARPENPRPASRFELEREEDDSDEPLFACKDEENCGWEGTEDECDEDHDDRRICPDCGKRVRKV